MEMENITEKIDVVWLLKCEVFDEQKADVYCMWHQYLTIHSQLVHI